MNDITKLKEHFILLGWLKSSTPVNKTIINSIIIKTQKSLDRKPK